MAVVDDFYCVPGIMSTAHNWKKRVKAFMIECVNYIPSPSPFDAELRIELRELRIGSVKHDVLPTNIPGTNMAIFTNPSIFKILLL